MILFDDTCRSARHCQDVSGQEVMIDQANIPPSIASTSPRSLPQLSSSLFDDDAIPRLDGSLKEEENDEKEEEESVLLSDFHDVLLELAASPDDMACFTITSAVGGAHLPTAFSLEELSPEECRDLSAVCFPVNGSCHEDITVRNGSKIAGSGQV
eukprot:XP_011673949.1 PREDICTED: uncharacterized protein LOC105442953 [Strongylocentrotus purpuratus]